MMVRDMSRLLLLSLFFAVGIQVMAQPREKHLAERADEAYAGAKWKSASTLYDVLLKDTTAYTPRFAKAVFASVMASDSVSWSKVDQVLIRNEYRLDSLFRDISRLSIHARLFDVYEQTLKRASRQFPLYQDTLTHTLIAYRKLLRQPEQIIRVADSALGKDPDSRKWLVEKAEAYRMKGEVGTALEVYKIILRNNPNDYESLVFIGNYYFLQGKKSLKSLADEAGSLVNPTQKESEAYNFQCRAVYRDYYQAASEYLERANALRPNGTLKATLYEIYVAGSQVEKVNTLKGTKRK